MAALYIVSVASGDRWKTYAFFDISAARAWMDELIDAGVDEQWDLLGPTPCEATPKDAAQLFAQLDG